MMVSEVVRVVTSTIRRQYTTMAAKIIITIINSRMSAVFRWEMVELAAEIIISKRKRASHPVD